MKKQHLCGTEGALEGLYYLYVLICHLMFVILYNIDKRASGPVVAAVFRNLMVLGSIPPRRLVVQSRYP